jgi:hypothetical protein
MAAARITSRLLPDQSRIFDDRCWLSPSRCRKRAISSAPDHFLQNFEGLLGTVKLSFSRTRFLSELRDLPPISRHVLPRSSLRLLRSRALNYGKTVGTLGAGGFTSPFPSMILSSNGTTPGIEFRYRINYLIDFFE